MIAVPVASASVAGSVPGIAAGEPGGLQAVSGCSAAAGTAGELCTPLCGSPRPWPVDQNP